MKYLCHKNNATYRVNIYISQVNVFTDVLTKQTLVGDLRWSFFTLNKRINQLVVNKYSLINKENNYQLHSFIFNFSNIH